MLDEQRKVMTQDVGALERKLAKTQLAVQELQQVARDVTNKEQRKAALARDIAAIPAGYDATRHTYLKAEVEQPGTPGRTRREARCAGRARAAAGA